jgi:hypothetical protein
LYGSINLPELAGTVRTSLDGSIAMSLTNETLMWLAPLAGAAAMTVTALISGVVDRRHSPQWQPDSHEAVARPVSGARKAEEH